LFTLLQTYEVNSGVEKMGRNEKLVVVWLIDMVFPVDFSSITHEGNLGKEKCFEENLKDFFFRVLSSAYIIWVAEMGNLSQICATLHV